MKGRVKWFDKKKGYGFIEGEDGKDYFAHHTSLPPRLFLRENDEVSFDAAQTEKGNQAQNIKLAGERGKAPSKGDRDHKDEEEDFSEDEEE